VQLNDASLPRHPVSTASLSAGFSTGKSLHPGSNQEISRCMPNITPPEEHLLANASTDVSKQAPSP
jgi:hypothetical protein